MVVLKGGERHLGIDNHVTLIGEVQDDIRHQSMPLIVVVNGTAKLIAKGHLFLKLDAFLQAHLFEQLLQAQLTKVALRLVVAGQCTSQVLGSLTHLLCLLQVFLD